MSDDTTSAGDASPPTNPVLTVDVDNPITLSTVFEDGSVEVISADEPANLQVRPDHGQVRLEATETSDRTFDTVLTGSPEAMATLADELYRAASMAAGNDGGASQ